MHFQLKQNYTFAIEPHLKAGVRLIIKEHGAEVACRKETFKNLMYFLRHEGRTFKGRVQLDKLNNNISIELKGEVIGSLLAKDLIDLLQQQPNYKKELIKQ